MHNYGLIIYKYNSNAISLSLSSLCVAERGLPIPDDGKGMESTTSKGTWVLLSSELIVEFIFNYFLSSTLWSSGNVLLWWSKTREGWPLPTVETEVNGESKSTNCRGSFLGWFIGLVVQVQEIFVLHCLSSSAQFKTFFSSPYTISIH